jgi:hypothetical protein
LTELELEDLNLGQLLLDDTGGRKLLPSRRLQTDFTEDWSSGISPWVSTPFRQDGSETGTATITNGGDLRLSSTASCFRSPFNGAGIAFTRSITLLPGIYSIQAAVEQEIDFYAVCRTSATVRSTIRVNSVVAELKVTSQSGTCGTSLEDFVLSGSFEVFDNDPVELLLSITGCVYRASRSGS